MSLFRLLSYSHNFDVRSPNCVRLSLWFTKAWFLFLMWQKWAFVDISPAYPRISLSVSMTVFNPSVFREAEISSGCRTFSLLELSTFPCLFSRSTAFRVSTRAWGVNWILFSVYFSLFAWDKLPQVKNQCVSHQIAVLETCFDFTRM